VLRHCRWSFRFLHLIAFLGICGLLRWRLERGKPRSEIGASFIEAMLDAGYKIMAAAVALDQIAQLRDDAEQHQVRAWRSG